MNQPTPRTEPGTTADEVTTLVGFLDYYRATLLRQTEGLTSAQLRARLEPSTLTLGGLLHHLAFVEHYWFGWVLAGRAPGEPWSGVDWDADPDWDFTAAAGLSPEQIRGVYLAEVAGATQILETAVAAGLDQTGAQLRHGSPVSLRWILVHMIEEYARHAGHADLIRESIDGATDL